jgi:hypothetical protein
MILNPPGISAPRAAMLPKVQLSSMNFSYFRQDKSKQGDCSQ